MADQVVHFEVIGADGSTLQKFYTELFGWHVQWVPEMNYGLVDTHAGKGINGGIGTSPEGNKYVIFYVAVDDLQGTLDKAVALGGSVLMPVTEIPGVVTMAQLADPEGHRMGLVWNDPNPPQAGGVSAGSNADVGWCEVIGKDGPKLRDFYGELFGWTFTLPPSGFDYGMTPPFDNGVGVGVGSGSHPEGPDMTTVYAGVQDPQAALDRAVELGASVFMPVTQMAENTWVAFFTDPEGNIFGLYKGM